MNKALELRKELAWRISQSFAKNPKAKVVMIAGSVGRGQADAYSDIEIDVYWSHPPSEEERRVAIEDSGASLLSLYPFEQDEWSEEAEIARVRVQTSTFLVVTMEGYLSEVIEHYSTNSLAQIRIAAVQQGVPVVGVEMVEKWRDKAARYPVQLSLAMVKENLDLAGLLAAAHMLAERNDFIAYYKVVDKIVERILGILLGLNQLYLPNPSFKWVENLVNQMVLCSPNNLLSRLQRIYKGSPQAGVVGLTSVVEDTFKLVESHFPEIDVSVYRVKAMAGRKPVTNIKSESII